MNFTDIYNSGEMIMPDGASCEYLIVLIFKQYNGEPVNAIGILQQDTEKSTYSVRGISLVNPKTNRVVEYGDINEIVSLGANLRKNTDLLQKYNELYGEIYDFVFSKEVTDEQKNMVYEFMDLREELLYTAELELSRKLSPEFFDWVDRIGG